MSFIAYHAKTENVALFYDSDYYWIGAFSSHTAQHLGSLSDPYVWVKGNYTTLEEGMAALAECTGNEF